MQAIQLHQFGAADQLQLEPIESPRPGPGEVVINMVAAGVNPID